MIIAAALLFMLLGAICIAFGPENSWFFVLGLAFIAAVPWMIWFDLRRAKRRLQAELQAQLQAAPGVVPAKTPAEADQAKLAASLEPPRYEPGQFGEGEFRSLSGRWRVVTVVTGATATLDGNEAIWSGHCGYRVTDTQGGGTVIEYVEQAEPPAPSFRFADDERSITLGEKTFELPAPEDS